MDTLEIKGKVSTAICYAKVVEDEAIEQIRRMCDYIYQRFQNPYYARRAFRKRLYDWKYHDDFG